MLSGRLLDHFQNPRNAGMLDSPPAVTVEVTNPVCGDILRLSATIESGRVEAIRYQIRGCTAAIACGSALTELLQGATLDQLGSMKAADIEAAVDGLPPASKHAALLCHDALRALLQKLH